MSERKVKPFSNGTDYMIWLSRNCDKCARNKGNSTKSNKKKCCPHEYELAIACIGDGAIPIRNYNTAFGNNGNCKRLCLELPKKKRKKTLINLPLF